MQLKKELNLFDIFSIASGAMISSGLFILPGLAHALAGPAVFLSYLLAGLLAMTGMISEAELASAMPKAGGSYFYITRSMGPALGSVYGLITWFSLSLKGAFALVGIAAFTVIIFNFNIHLIAIILCSIFIIINLVGIKEAGRIQVFLVIGMLAILFLYVVLGLPAVKLKYLTPFAPNGVSAIFSTAGFVFVSYGGLLKISSIAEEVKNPGKTIPLGMILSLFVVTVFYMLVVFVTTGVLDASKLDNSLTPISDGAAVFLGRWGRIMLSLTAIIAFITTVNAGIISASRFPLALSRDALIPNFLSKINARFKTPHFAILITGLFMIIVVFLKLPILVKAASSVLILTYMFSCLSVIIMRESRLQNYQPLFRAPLYPWIQIVGIIGFGFLLFEMGKEALLMCSVFILGGLFVYRFYGRIRSSREYALLHLVERITAKELTTHSLETELKEIIRERDDIIKDRFDHIIEESLVLDINQSITLEEFFRLVADSMSKRLAINADTLYQALINRERENTTVLNPDLAVPHIVIEGEHKFDILLARCKQGIVFSDKTPKVHSVFVLAGTRDERNFHLRALASIAQIVQEFTFERRWMKAKNKEVLRDIVLLGKRRRH